MNARVIALGLVLMLGSIAPFAVARHNSVGVWTTAGSGPPSELGGADSPASLLPKYHVNVLDDPNTPAFEGRISPPDRSYRANWVGFLDGEFEYFPTQYGPLFINTDDPLYRANPAPGDATCSGLADQLDPAKCEGIGHEQLIDAEVGVDNDFLDQGGRAVAGQLGRSTASGTLYPGVYTPYVYLFGKPSASHGTVTVSPGSGAFANVPANVCMQSPSWGGGACVLLNPADLQAYAAASPENDIGNLCAENVQFHLATGTPDPNAPCGAGLHMFHSDFYLDSGQIGNYIIDRPGWRFLVTYLLGPKPGSLICTDAFTRCDVRDVPDWVNAGANDVKAGHHGSIMKGLSFHYTVNPVPVDRRYADLTCVVPSIATDAGTKDGVIRGEGNYLYAAHDLDVYASPIGPEVQAVMNTIRPAAAAVGSSAAIADFLVSSAEDPVRMVTIIQDQFLDPTIDSLLPPAVAAAVDDASERTAVFQSSEAYSEPNLAVGSGNPNPNPYPANEFTVSIPAGSFQCQTVAAQQELVGSTGDTLKGALRVNVGVAYDTGPGTRIGLAALRDPDTVGARDDQTPYTAWHAGIRNIGGDVRGVVDDNKNGQLDGCAQGGRARLSFEDSCPWGLLWDTGNTGAQIGGCGPTTLTVRDCAISRGYNVNAPNGLVQIWRVSGPVVVIDEDAVENTNAPDDSTGRIFPDLGSGPKCIVGYSKGLLAQLNAAPATKALVLASCNGRATTVEIADAFDDQGAFGTFSGALSVVSGNAETGDGVALVAVVSTTAGGLTDDNTSVNLAAGSTLLRVDDDAF